MRIDTFFLFLSFVHFQESVCVCAKPHCVQSNKAGQENVSLLCVFFFPAASGGTAYVSQLAMAVLRHPTGQVLFATWFAALAGLAAWYLM